MKPWSRPWNVALTLALAATVVVVSCLLLPRDDGGAAAFSPDGSLTRDRIPDRYKWDLAPLFADDAAWERALAEVSAGLERLEAFRGKLSDPAQLARCLTLYMETRLATNRVTLYAALRLETQHESAPLQAMKDRSLAVLDRLMAAAAFIRQEVLRLDDAAMERAYAAAPGLAEHRPYLGELRRRRSRVLGEEGERLLTLAGDNLWAEIDLNEIPSDHEKTFLALLTDMPLPKVRDEKGVCPT